MLDLTKAEKDKISRKKQMDIKGVRKIAYLTVYDSKIYMEIKGHLSKKTRNSFVRLKYISTKMMWYYPDTGLPKVFKIIDICEDKGERVSEVINLLKSENFIVKVREGFMEGYYFSENDLLNL